MFNISKPNEARDILAKDELSHDDVKELLLYLVQRDEETRKAFRKAQALIIASMETCRALLLGVSKLGLANSDPELQHELQRASEAIEKAHELMADDGSIH